MCFDVATKMGLSASKKNIPIRKDISPSFPSLEKPKIILCYRVEIAHKPRKQEGRQAKPRGDGYLSHIAQPIDGGGIAVEGYRKGLAMNQCLSSTQELYSILLEMWPKSHPCAGVRSLGASHRMEDWVCILQ